MWQVRDLEGELENEARRVREAVAMQRKSERVFKELQAATEEERRQLAEIASLNDQLSLRIKTYKRQLEEAVSCSLALCVCVCVCVCWCWSCSCSCCSSSC